MNIKHLSLLLLLCLVSVSISFAQRGKIKQLPQFEFVDLEGQTFTNASLQPGLKTVVFFYDPYCDHCQQEATWIAESAQDFQNIQLLWVTTETAESVEEFRNTYFQDANLEHLHFLLDTGFMFDTFFGYSEAPSIYLYSAKGVKIGSYTEEVEPNTLLQKLGK